MMSSAFPVMAVHGVARSYKVPYRVGVEQILLTHVFPLPSIDSVDETAWTDRLVNVLKGLNAKSHKILFNMGGLRTV